MYTNKKYTLIVSAFQDGETLENNLNNSASLERTIELITNETAQRATGTYHGTSEVSFVIHTDEYKVLRDITDHVTEFYAQDAVLISFNADYIVELYFGDNSEPLTVGTHFVPGKGDGQNYTTLGRQNWSVAA